MNAQCENLYAWPRPVSFAFIFNFQEVTVSSCCHSKHYGLTQALPKWFRNKCFRSYCALYTLFVLDNSFALNIFTHPNLKSIWEGAYRVNQAWNTWNVS